MNKEMSVTHIKDINNDNSLIIFLKSNDEDNI